MTSKKNKKLHKEIRKKYTSGPICTVEEGELYPELFLFFTDENIDIHDRKVGISPLSRKCYLKIKSRYENGEYPEHLKRLAEMELRLKIRES